MSRIEAPMCRNCALLTATPLRDLPSGATTDRFYRLASDLGEPNAYCPVCGTGFRLPPAELAQATRALREYYDSHGWDPGPETDIERAHPLVSLDQLALPLDAKEPR